MKLNFALKLLALTAISIAVTSCNKSNNYKTNSRGTGWDITGKDGGFKATTE